MAKSLGGIKSFVAANDWWCTNDSGVTFDPVCCWAIAMVIDSRYLAAGPEEWVVGLVADEVGGPISLAESVFEREYLHRDEFEIVGQSIVEGRYPRKAFSA